MTTKLGNGSRLLWLLTLLVAGALVVAACGDDEDEADGGGGGDGAAEIGDTLNAKTSNPDGERGGTLTISSAGDVDYMDPGKAYYQFSYMIMQHATQRPLYSYQPDEIEKPSPDLAESDPEISEDGRTVTVTIKDGVRFSPPVDREVTSADVKYAIERGFLPSVANGYAGPYFGDLEGVNAFQDGEADEISGIQTPDDRTIVFKLTRGTGAVLAGALALPLSAPVPEEYAREFDQQNPSTYGQHVVFTGPYMVENNAQGELTGYNPGRFIRMERNPNWDPDTDFRPAYVDRIVVEEGQDDATVGSRQILQGQSTVSSDFEPPASVLKSLVGGANREQLTIVPGGGVRYIALKTEEEPFNDINVRKAVVAAMDREALRLTRGGETVGAVATHYIPPGMPGFEEAGGFEGPELDFMASPTGDMELAREYLRKAGFENGRYNGPAISMVADTADPDRETAQVAIQRLEELGFDVRSQFVTRDTMYTKFCNVPNNQPDVCPNVGWLKDFNDPQTILGPTFNGDAIVSQNNSNWPLLDVPEINRAMDEAALLTDLEERAEAWGEIDRMVTEQAAAVPYIWDSTPMIRSQNVVGVVNLNNATWDPSFTSLE